MLQYHIFDFPIISIGSGYHVLTSDSSEVEAYKPWSKSITLHYIEQYFVPGLQRSGPARHYTIQFTKRI